MDAGKLEDKTMQAAAKMYRLGGKYERADQVNDFKALMAIEREINAIADANPEMWLDPFVVRGRNFLRKLRGQEQSICVN